MSIMEKKESGGTRPRIVSVGASAQPATGRNAHRACG